MSTGLTARPTFLQRVGAREGSGGPKQRWMVEESGGGEATMDGKWMNLPFLTTELHL